MTVLGRLADRVIRLLGFGLDFSVDLRRQPFSAIRPALFVGARPREEDTQALKEAGITHVVSCLAEDYRPRVAFLANDFECLFLPLRDGIHEDIASSFAPFFDFAGQVRNAHDEAKLLVHCEVGVSRSATLATALVMSSEGKSLFDAFSEVRCKRPEVLVNIGFASQLQRLEHTLSPGLRDDSQLSSLARYLKQVCSVPAEAELLQEMLARHDYDAPRALRSLFDNEIPRVVQGVRL